MDTWGERVWAGEAGRERGEMVCEFHALGKGAKLCRDEGVVFCVV